MSSVHSQSSDSVVQPQMQVVEAAAQRFSDKTPAIKEEEEMTDSEVVRKKKPSLLRKKSSLHSSPNSTSSSNSNGNSNRSVSTITFEKQKVVPHRARTQSAQSVLSSISLRSLLHQNNMQNQQQQPPQQSGEQETPNVNITNLNQQIQSPALSSIRRRGINSNNANSGSNGAANSASTARMFRRSSSENEIGLHVPFTDDKRRDLEGSSAAPQRRLSKSSLSKENTTRTKNNGMELDKNDDGDHDEDADCQKRLTTQALRKLSNFTGKANLRRNAENNVNEQDNAKSEPVQDSPRNDLSENGARNNDSDTTEDSFINHAGSMTHLKFGNKKVMLDSSSFNPSAYPNKAPSSGVSRPPATIRKHSLDVIRQPNSAANTISAPNTNSKRFVKQICNPKKPLYMPAVLRDVSETNITIDDVVRPASPQHTLTSGSQNINIRRNQSASSQASISSAHSSILESCKRHISSFFFPGKDHLNPDSIGSEAPAPPTREHWLPDSKRSSCHYCHKIFTFLERKHHCRHCGDIFCQQHLAHWLYLNSNAEFMIGCGGMSTLSKICDNCLGDYESMIKNPTGKDKKTNRQMVRGDVSNAHLAASQTNKSSGPEAINVEQDSNGDNASADKSDVIGSVVGSVPADWNWSSF